MNKSPFAPSSPPRKPVSSSARLARMLPTCATRLVFGLASSKVVPGVHDRVLTVTGALVGISKAYRMVSKGLLEGVPQVGMGGIISNNGTHGKQIRISPGSISTVGLLFA